MTYPNAAKGISKIFTAQILSLIASVVTLIGALMGVGAVGAASQGAGDAAGGLALGGMGIAFIAAILVIIGGILTLVGLWQAGKDEQRYFKMAFWMSIISLVISVIVSGLATSNPELSLICDVVQRVLSILVLVFTIYGIGSLAQTLGNDDLAKTGNKILVLIIIVMVIAIILQLVANVTFAGIAAIVATVLMIVSYIVYLVLLSRAKKFFATH